jgi:hypothetical protein
MQAAGTIKPPALALPVLSKSSRASRPRRRAEDIRYPLNHWEGLTRFLDDGRIERRNASFRQKFKPRELSGQKPAHEQALVSAAKPLSHRISPFHSPNHVQTTQALLKPVLFPCQSDSLSRSVRDDVKRIHRIALAAHDFILDT